jgi:hypothetical protein
MRNGILYPNDPGGPMASRGLGAQCSLSRRWAHVNAWAYLLCVFTVAECHAQATSAQRPSRDGNLPVARLDEAKSIDEYRIDFRKGEYDARWLKMDGAPGTVKLVQPDKRGLRFTIPNGLGEGPAVATKFGIRGDFEITATFEVLSRLRPDVGYGMGADMLIKPPGAWDKFASISRFSKTGDTVFSMVHKDKVGEKEKWNAKLHPTQATSGRLRLVRVGPTLHYQLAEGDAKIFHEMFVSEYGAEDLEFVRLSATTGGSKKAVDLLWKDLSVRAEELPGWVGPDLKSRRSPPWITAVFVSAALLLGLMGLVWWLASSRRARTGPALEDVGPDKTRPTVVVKRSRDASGTAGSSGDWFSEHDPSKRRFRR